MRRRELLGLAAAAAGAGCADLPPGRRRTTESGGRAGADVEVGPVEVQPSVLAGDSAFDVRGAPGGAFVRVPVRLHGRDGAPTPSPNADEHPLGDLSVDLDGRTFQEAVVDLAGGLWDRVLAVEVPSGEYADGEVRLEVGAGDPIRRPIPDDALAALADPPAFAVRDFVVSDPIEMLFVVVTMTVENVGGAGGRFLAGLGPTDGPSPVVVAFPVRPGERVTQTRTLTLHDTSGPVTVRLQWDGGSSERRVVQPGT